MIAESRQNHGQWFKHILLLTLAVLVTYLNATRTGTLVLDDMALIESLHSGSPSFSMFHAADGPKYFRPLAYLSFFFDAKVLGGDPAMFHVVNIVIHICNSLLVYGIALRLAGETFFREKAALLAGLLFAVHPVNSEAVIWISSRYDLLCCFFFLASLYLVTAWRRLALPVAVAGLFLAFLASLLAKESSLLLPVAVFVLLYDWRKRILPRQAVAILAILMFALLSYLYLRNGLAVAADKGIGGTLAGAGASTAGLFADCLAGIGFYLRKMLYPFPLSFAIASIDRTSNILFAALLFIPIIVIFLREKAFRFPLALMLTSLAPPLYAMIGHLPWTPYAERYLYIPMTGFSLLVAFLYMRWMRQVSFPLMVSAVMLLALPTFLRVTTWMHPVVFWEDSIRKMPGFGTPHLLLASELISANRLPEAEQHIRKARELGLARADAKLFADKVQAALAATREKTAMP